MFNGLCMTITVGTVLDDLPFSSFASRAAIYIYIVADVLEVNIMVDMYILVLILLTAFTIYGGIP